MEFFDVAGNDNGAHIDQFENAATLAPRKKLPDCLSICGTCIFVANVGDEEFYKAPRSAFTGANTLAQWASGQPITVVAPDFTRSVTVARTADGQTEHKKTLDATAMVLSRLPPATQFSVIGITEASYSRPLLILSGQIPSDPGPLEFVNRVELARTRTAKQFRTAAERIAVTAQKTDVIGAFFIASEILQKDLTRERNLVFLSDMRQSAAPLDIETPKLISVKDALSTVAHNHLFPDLKGVDVWIIGVDAAGKDVAYISSLREFWAAFLARSGAHLRAFSMMRELPDLSHPGSKGDHP